MFPMGIIALLLAMTMLSVTTSRPLLDHHHHHHRVTTGFKVMLKHVDSGGNLTKLELFQRAVVRGNKRIQRLYAMALAAYDSSIESPVHAGSGEFLMELSIGTPPGAYSAILDTGSDLIWTQCKPCQHCFTQSSPIFDPTKSSSFYTVPCSSDLCAALPTSSCSDGGCEYLYTYGDDSSTQGIMATETLTFGNVSVPEVGLGCSLDTEGTGFSQASGLVGLGRGSLSLVSQLDEPKFSYCLTSMDSNTSSTLLMGSLASVDSAAQQDSIKTTPLIKSLSQPSFYYVSLEGITVGGKRLPIKKNTFSLKDDGSGGMIVDSGTTITHLEKRAFNLLKKEFTNQMKLPVDNSNETGLNLCFKLPLSGDHEISVPNLVFHFEGADLDLAGENYIIVDPSSGVACLAMAGSSGMSIFGNFQQQNMLVVHDLHQETLSFMPANCDQL